MNKLAFVFPGQGAQTVGMGKDFCEQYDIAKKLFAQADEALGYSIKDMCFEGPAEDLKLTANTQPAILTMSVIANEILKEHDIQPDVVVESDLRRARLSDGQIQVPCVSDRAGPYSGADGRRRVPTQPFIVLRLLLDLFYPPDLRGDSDVDRVLDCRRIYPATQEAPAAMRRTLNNR